jgi:hypothetical protein
LIGLYENFPDVHHGIAHFLGTVPTQDLQRTLLQFLRKLNEKNENLSLADGLTFDYLNEENYKHCLNEISKNVLPALDLFIVVRYYVPDGAKRKPLKFDYYLVRILFREQEHEILVHHEKGPRHLAVEELIDFYFNRINRELKAQKLNPLERGLTRAV